MIGFFKGIGKGFLNVLFLPFGLTGIAIYAVFGVFVFAYRFLKLIFLFFTGRNLSNELKEDRETKRIIDASKNNKETPSEPSLSLYPSDSDLYKAGYVSPVFEKREINEPSSIEGEKEHE